MITPDKVPLHYAWMEGKIRGRIGNRKGINFHLIWLLKIFKKGRELEENYSPSFPFYKVKIITGVKNFNS